MKAYKRYLVGTFLLTGLFCLSYELLVANYFRKPAGEMLWIKNSFAKKEAFSAGIKGKKIVFTGGSATLFGVKARDIQRETGVPTVNFAVHAGLGLDYVVYRTKKILRPGDVVIMPLEYRHFYYDGGYARIKHLFLRTYDRRYFKRLSKVERLSYLFKTSIVDFLEAANERYLFDLFDGREGALTATYYSQTLNENGDETSNIGNVKMKKIIETMEPIPIIKGEFSESVGLKIIKEFNEWCKKNDVSLYVTYANTVRFASYDGNRAYIEFFSKIQDYLAAKGIKTIGTPEDSFYHVRWFYDTKYHLNQRGATARTEWFVDMISKMSILE
jgi:hypothetical protein